MHGLQRADCNWLSKFFQKGHSSSNPGVGLSFLNPFWMGLPVPSALDIPTVEKMVVYSVMSVQGHISKVHRQEQSSPYHLIFHQSLGDLYRLRQTVLTPIQTLDSS